MIGDEISHIAVHVPQAPGVRAIASNRSEPLGDAVVSLAGLGVFMLGMSFAAVPLYDLFCRVTGYGGTVTQADKGADQVLEFERRVLAKPKDPNRALEDLIAMRGKTHRLHSAAVLYHDGAPIWRHAAQVRLHMAERSKAFAC